MEKQLVYVGSGNKYHHVPNPWDKGFNQGGKSVCGVSCYASFYRDAAQENGWTPCKRCFPALPPAAGKGGT